MTSAVLPASFEIVKERGQALIELPLAPVSAQAKAPIRADFRKAIRDIIATKDVVLLNDVAIDVKWHVHELMRYESDATPDVDNILKPTLDAMSGPGALLINDCQVQAITSFWVDGYYDLQLLEIRLRFEPDFAIARSSLVFVRVAEQLYVPLDDSMDPEITLVLIDLLERQFEMREKLLQLGNEYRTAKLVMPGQRVYHRTRIAGFILFEKEEYRGLLRSRQK